MSFFFFAQIDEKRKERRVSKKRCISLPATINMGYNPTIQTTDESNLSSRNLEAFDKRSRKVSLMVLPNQSTYRKTSERSIVSDFQNSVCSIHHAISQENVDGLRNQEIFDKRKTRRPSLLSIPPSSSNKTDNV